jgi:hypothetical protein
MRAFVRRVRWGNLGRLAAAIAAALVLATGWRDSRPERIRPAEPRGREAAAPKRAAPYHRPSLERMRRRRRTVAKRRERDAQHGSGAVRRRPAQRGSGQPAVQDEEWVQQREQGEAEGPVWVPQGGAEPEDVQAPEDGGGPSPSGEFTPDPAG